MAFPSIPDYTLMQEGTINAYHISVSALRQLGNYMWSDGFLDTIKHLNSAPSECIIGMIAIPFKPNSLGNAAIKLGNMVAPASAPIIRREFSEVDCGSIEVKPAVVLPPPASGLNFSDFEPYTKFLLFLPYIGYVPIASDLIMNHTVKIKYHCNSLFGTVTAFVGVLIDGDYKIVAQHEGNAALNMPITGATFGKMYESVAKIVSGAATMVAVGNPLPLLGSAASMFAGGLCPDYSSSGTMSGNSGVLSFQKPFLIRIRKPLSVPSNFNHVQGRPSNIGAVLGSLSGYTKVTEVHLTEINATSDELGEIENLLKDGVVI